MKFRIIEKPTPDYDIKKVLHDYTNTKMSVKSIREKYNISQGTWNTILRHFREDGGELRAGKNNAKYYTYNKKLNRFIVQRTYRFNDAIAP